MFLLNWLRLLYSIKETENLNDSSHAEDDLQDNGSGNPVKSPSLEHFTDQNHNNDLSSIPYSPKGQDFPSPKSDSVQLMVRGNDPTEARLDDISNEIDNPVSYANGKDNDLNSCTLLEKEMNLVLAAANDSSEQEDDGFESAKLLFVGSNPTGSYTAAPFHPSFFYMVSG